MKTVAIVPAFFGLLTLAACSGSSPYDVTAAAMGSGALMPRPAGAVIAAPYQTMGMVKDSDACGASQFQALVGGPSIAVMALNIPDDSRHYGSDEPVATNVPSRLNFVHSGSAVDAVANPASRVVRVFCG